MEVWQLCLCACIGVMRGFNFLQKIHNVFAVATAWFCHLHTLVLRSGHVHCMHINWVKFRQKSETSASRRSAMCFIWLEAWTSCQILSKNSKVSTSLCSAMGFILIQSPVRHVVSLASTSGQIQSKNSKVSTSLCSVMWFILLQSPAGHVAYLRTWSKPRRSPTVPLPID